MDDPLWFQHNPDADALVVYVTGEPIPTLWNDVDEFAYLGFAIDNETEMLGVMIEHCSKWWLMPGKDEQTIHPHEAQSRAEK